MTVGRKGAGLLACLGALGALSALAAWQGAAWYDDATTTLGVLYGAFAGGNAAEWLARRGGPCPEPDP